MNAIELPAMVGTDPLGFLSALGVLRLLADHEDRCTRLSWDRTSGTAIVHTTIDSVEELGEWLVSVALSTPHDGVLPGADPSIPVKKMGTAGRDPMRPPRHEFEALVAQVHSADATWGPRWLEVIVTDLACDRDGRVALTPWMSPSGQQTVRTFFEKPLDQIRRDSMLLRDAPQTWRRVAGYSGEYLDQRAINDAAADVTGRSSEMGAPGPTWLAAMALPLLRTSGSGGQEVLGSLWGNGRSGRDFSPSLAIWPLWEPALDIDAVAVLLEHPVLRQRDSAVDRRLRALGVFRRAAAQRRQIPGRKFRGVLAPAEVPRTDHGRPTPPRDGA